MTLNLYRRHRRDCKAHHPEDSLSGEFDERRKGWARCACPIFLSGTLQKKFRRQSSGEWEWPNAKAVAALWEDGGTWDAPQPRHSVEIVAPEPREDERGGARCPVADAAQAFLAKCQNRAIADATLRKYKTFIKQLAAYCDGRGYLYIDELTVSDADRVYAEWKDGIRAKAKKLERFKAFVKFCIKRRWLAENIAEDLTPAQGSSIPAGKAPFSDEELTRIYVACGQFGPPVQAGPGYRPWGGEDAKDFIMLSVYTGLRISDVCLFDISKRLKGNDLFLRQHKTRKELFTWIPDWLVARLREREKNHGPMIFKYGQSVHLRTVTEEWRRKLKKIFAIAGTFDTPPTPHRLRHTFVRILLEKGVPLADIAELAGDTEAVLRKHYSKWIESRQHRLTAILKEAFEDKPRPKLVSIH